MIRAFILAAFIAGCAAPSQPVQTVVWIRPTTQAEVTKLCKNPRCHGCQWHEGGICYVVAMDYGGDTLTTLGHELKHCFDDAWHSDGIISRNIKDN